MEMSFKEALDHAIRVSGRAKSMRDVATKAGVSYDIIKNMSANKSQKPNAEFATRVADFFLVSVKDFYAGRIPKVSDEEAAAIMEDTAKISDLVRHLGKVHRDEVQALARSLHRVQQETEQGE